MFLKEVPVESLAEALKAEAQGANRIELCDNLFVGGTTPSYGTIRICKKILQVPIMVMIRPRGGNFVYTSHETEAMIEDIKTCKKIGVNGIVTGVLKDKNQIDIKVLKLLINEAKPLEITFHKAIDETPDPILSLKQLIELGIKRVLTSGQAATAQEGSIIMNKMIKKADSKIIVMPSGKISNKNFQQIRELIPCYEYHGRTITGPLDI